MTNPVSLAGYVTDPDRVALLLIDPTKGCGARNSPFTRWMRDNDIDASYFFDQLEGMVVPNQLRLLQRFRDLGAATVFTRPLIMRDDAGDWPRGYRANLAAIQIAPCRPGSEFFEWLTEFDVGEQDLVVDKVSISAFHGGNLAALLHHRGIEHVYVTGSTTNSGVGVNALDAANLGFEVTVVDDATCAFSEEIHTTWLALHEFLIDTRDTEQVLSELPASVV